MASHSSTLAWRIPWTEEPDRLQSIGLQTVRHNCGQLHELALPLNASLLCVLPILARVPLTTKAPLMPCP